MVSSIPVQIASELKLDYKPIHQYAKLLVENGLAIADNRESHGITDFLTPLTEKNYDAFVGMPEKIGKMYS